MISNISCMLPSLLKNMRDKNNDLNPNNLKYDLVETINFYNSILPKEKALSCLKHMYLDCLFEFHEDVKDSINSFAMTIDTVPFLKDFEYELHPEDGVIIIRSNYEELAILSLILMGSIKNLKKDMEVINQSIFISLAFHFLSFCINNGYKVCNSEDIKYLEDYNVGFDKKMFKKISIYPSSEHHVGTLHFVGIELNKDILIIFEKYKNVKFTYNEENASFIISMAAKDWDDYWIHAPQYLRDEFASNKAEKIDVR